MNPTYTNIYFLIALNGWAYEKMDAIYCVLQINNIDTVNPVSFFGYQEVYTLTSLSTDPLTFTNYTTQS